MPFFLEHLGFANFCVRTTVITQFPNFGKAIMSHRSHFDFLRKQLGHL